MKFLLISMKNIVADYFRLMRIPGIAAIALPPVFGAISVNELSFSVLIPLFIIGILSGIYGFVMNDYMDIEVDKLSKDLSIRSLVKGTISKKTAKIIIILCFLLAYIFIFIFFYRSHILFYVGLSCIIIADILGIIYNTYGKKIIGSDFLIALAESLYFLFGALIVLKSGTLSIITWVIFILTFNQTLFINAVIGGLKDADHDYLMNVKNIALRSGVKVKKDKTVFVPVVFKIFGMGIRVFSCFLIFVPFVFYNINYEIWQISLIVFVSAILIIASWLMLNIKYFDRKRLRKTITLQLFARYSLVPLMLITFIGIWFSIFLIIFPFAWYIFFSFIIGQSPFEGQI